MNQRHRWEDEGRPTYNERMDVGSADPPRRKRPTAFSEFEKRQAWAMPSAWPTLREVDQFTRGTQVQSLAPYRPQRTHVVAPTLRAGQQVRVPSAAEVHGRRVLEQNFKAFSLRLFHIDRRLRTRKIRLEDRVALAGYRVCYLAADGQACRCKVGDYSAAGRCTQQSLPWVDAPPEARIQLAVVVKRKEADR